MEAQTAARRTRQRSREDEILDAARGLFFKKGYRGTTIEQIASRAGYSKRTIYLDYASKDDLFITICVEGGELLLEKFAEIPQDEFSVQGCIEQIINAYVAFSRYQSEYFRMIFSESTPEIIANCSEELRVLVADLERACLGVVVAWAERAMREGLIARLDPWEVAGIVVGSATGIILLSMGGRQTVFTRETLESLVHEAVRTLWKGLRVSDEFAGADLQGQEA
jgi:AcrR family transcriptional regulator